MKGKGNEPACTAWDNVKSRGKKADESKQPKKPKQIEGRIRTNFEVLQRLPKPGKNERNPYGAKPAQLGHSVDIKYIRPVIAGIMAEDIPAVEHYRLNTTHEPWDPSKGTARLFLCARILSLIEVGRPRSPL